MLAIYTRWFGIGLGASYVLRSCGLELEAMLCRVGLAVESLKKKAKGMYNAEYWRQYEKKEVAVIRDPDVYEQLYELVCSAERSLLYTTNFQFNILNAFHALIQTNTGLRKIDHPEMKQFMAEIDLLVPSAPLFPLILSLNSWFIKSFPNLILHKFWTPSLCTY